MDDDFKWPAIMFIGIALAAAIGSFAPSDHAKIELKSLQSECIRLGYGERDTDGNFRLKEME